MRWPVPTEKGVPFYVLQVTKMAHVLWLAQSIWYNSSELIKVVFIGCCEAGR